MTCFSCLTLTTKRVEVDYSGRPHPSPRFCQLVTSLVTLGNFRDYLGNEPVTHLHAVEVLQLSSYISVAQCPLHTG